MIDSERDDGIVDDRQKRKLEVEEEKQAIRDRTWKSEEYDVEYHPADPQPTIDDDRQMRVAAYTRVSTSNVEQISSIENQTRFYTEKIEGNPNWSMVGIYSDEGKSGTSMKKRTAFLQLLADAQKGQIDLIICSSVSRFARNVVDCIDQVNFLKTNDPKHPVGVYFETENIFTLNPNSNQALEIHAMLADWESGIKSSRMILSYDQRIIMKHYPVLDLLGYRHTKDGKLIIHEEEAKTVKLIFIERALGMPFDDIAEELSELERTTLAGSTEWSGSMAREITKNERRWGDLEARKSTTLNYRTGKKAKNTYIADGVVHHIRNCASVKDHHEGIVSRELAMAVHMISDHKQGLDCGISDIVVIDKGALKGFVGVSPGWNGIDEDLYMELCQSVYSETELVRIRHQMRIRKGDDPAENVSGMRGYDVPYGAYFISPATSTITITRTSFKFNKKLTDMFGDFSFVEVLYNPLLQLLAFRSCSVSSATGFCMNDDDGTVRKSLYAPAICGSIYKNMDWIETFRFKFRGVYRERDGFQIMLFYLDEPLIIPDKKTKEQYKISEGDIKNHYIPYRNSELSEDANITGIRDMSVSLRIRAMRDKLIDSITGADIAQTGIVMENRKIGHLPTRHELEEMREELILSMHGEKIDGE